MADNWKDRIERATRVDTATGCIVWTGYLNVGYGRIRRGGKKELVHRVVWEEAHGPIPDGLIVRHAVCDNRACVNLEHLALGTHADNMKDMVEHGRSAKGDKIFLRQHPERAARPGAQNGMSKLTARDVLEMRRLRSEGMKLSDLAQKFGVVKSAVSAICSGKRWAGAASQT